MTATQERPRISELIRNYQYPRTVAELLVLRRDQLEVMGEQEPRICPSSREHGAMPLRPLERQPYEQLYCGLWWDCEHCGSSSVQQSRDLAYDHGEPYNSGQGWERFTPGGWVPVSAEEAEAFYARLIAWNEARQPKPRRKRQTAAHRHAQAPR